MRTQRTQRFSLCSQKEYPLIEVHSTLEPGLLENVYEEALSHEFTLRGIAYDRQKEISLKYKGKDIGRHRIDFLVEDEVIVELKAV